MGCRDLKAHLEALDRAGRLHRVRHAGEAGACLAISMRPQYPDQALQVMWAVWAIDPALGKITVMVDDDIDVRDPFQLNWALSWWVQPHKDVYIFPTPWQCAWSLSRRPRMCRGWIPRGGLWGQVGHRRH